MLNRTVRTVVLLFAVLLPVAGMPSLAHAQKIPAGIGEGWLPEFNHASSQIVALAEAIPAEKYTWRPGPGVRSISEVYMHIAIANYFFLSQVGVTAAAEKLSTLTPDTEKKVTAKEEVIQWLKSSQDLVRESYPKANLPRKVKFLGKDTTVEAVYLRCIVHSNEHMGQSIAYARINGIVPPWSE
jgi:uncharacterized damage-inducible protein DinB